MSSKDKEKFYWWKKDKNYYGDHRLKALEKERNGYAFSILLEKLKCESTPYLGTLKYSENRAFSLSELAAVVDMPTKLVKAGLDALQEKELINVLEDGTIEILEFINCVGFETGAAKRMKEARNYEQKRNKTRTNEEQNGNISGTFVPRYKSQDIRDKSIDNIFVISSSIIDKYLGIGVSSEELENIKNIILKAIQTTNASVDDETIDKIIKELWINKNIINPEKYVIKWLKNLKEHE